MKYRELLKQELPLSGDLFFYRGGNLHEKILDLATVSDGLFGKNNKGGYETYFNKINFTLKRVCKHNKELG